MATLHFTPLGSTVLYAATPPAIHSWQTWRARDALLQRWAGGAQVATGSRRWRCRPSPVYTIYRWAAWGLSPKRMVPPV